LVAQNDHFGQLAHMSNEDPWPRRRPTTVHPGLSQRGGEKKHPDDQTDRVDLSWLKDEAEAQRAQLKERYERERQMVPRAITVIRGDDETHLVLREERTYLFGRTDGAEVAFDQECVSRRHAVLKFTDGQWRIRDLGSTNGVHRVDPETRGLTRLASESTHEVHPHDVYMLGGPSARLAFLAEIPQRAWAQGAGSTWRSQVGQLLDEEVEIASRTDSPVFLLGASGVGKTTLAHQIHLRNQRKGPFISINCARLSDDVAQLQSELLGHVAGAYTGAERNRVGKFYEADGGTLFLDEVESLPEAAQGFLLDVLEGSGEYLPLGADYSQENRPPPSFRLISASKKRLGQSGLRFDLCERLGAGFLLVVPPLEERKEDIPAFIEMFLSELAEAKAIGAEFTEEAIAHAQRLPWPGQIRQLKAMVENTVFRVKARHPPGGAGRGRLVIHRQDIQEWFERRQAVFGEGAFFGGDQADGEGPFGDPLRAIPSLQMGRTNARALTAEVVAQALSASGGNKSEAARRLGIARNTLAAKMKKFGLQENLP
jgi:DNA-binding NtrC family response regulator